MAKIDVPYEIVKNHSTEEVVTFLKKELARMSELANDDTRDECLRLGALSRDLTGLLSVAVQLDTKLTVSSPVVA